MAGIFKDRKEAGQLLARNVLSYAGGKDAVVLALPRGGVPVGFEVAKRLSAPLDVVVVRKLGVPGHEEYAMGAIATGGFRVLNQQAIDWLGLTDEVIEEAMKREKVELRRRELLYRGDRPPMHLRGKVVVLVDDGIATGSTMRAAARFVRSQSPTELFIAVPVAPASVYDDFAGEADLVITLMAPKALNSVGEWYGDFHQVSDDEVARLMDASISAQT